MGEKPAPDTARVDITARYFPITADDLSAGFFDRESTESYIEALASLDTVTLYAGAGVSADVGAPLSDELMPWMLKELLDHAEPDLTVRQRQRVVDALKAAYLPAYLGSIIREHERLRGDRDDPDKWSTFATHLTHAIEAGHTTGGFLARSLAALAFALRKAGKDNVQVFTTNYDDKICEEEKKVHDYFPALAEYSFAPHTLNSAEGMGSYNVPLYHLNGDLKTRPSLPPDPLVLGEADFFARYASNLMPLTTEHERRSQLLDKALTQSACLFVGSSLTDPDVLAKLATTKFLQARYAIVLTPPLHLTQPDEQAAALNLVAQRFLHLGIVPIIVDFPHQVPQLLIEVALRLQQNADYLNYVARLDRWWHAWAKEFGFRPEYAKNGGKRDEALQKVWMKTLASLRRNIATRHLKLPSRHADRDEEIQVEVWLRHPSARSLVLWATSEGIWLNANTAHQCPIHEGEDFAAQRAFRRGQAVFGEVDPPRGQWRYQLSMPLVLHEDPWHHLPVGVASVLSSKGPTIRNEDGKVTRRGGKLSAFVESANLAKDLAALEDDIKKAVNKLLDPNSTASRRRRRKG